MGQALGRGMTLALSIWNDVSGYMNWLDSGNSGPCSATEGNPALIIQNNPNTHVVFSNIRWGDIGSTTGDTGGISSSIKSTTSMTSTKVSTSTTTRATSTTTASGPQQTHYGQCGGNNYSGPKICASPYKCVYVVFPVPDISQKV